MGSKQNKAHAKKQNIDLLTDVPAKLIILLYVIVELIPNWGSIDVMGTQWLYISVLNVICLIYILNNKDNYVTPVHYITRSLINVLYVAVFILSGISILFAFNKIESLVVYARFANALTGFFILAILIYNRPKLLNFMAGIFSLLLAYQSMDTILSLVKGLNNDYTLEKIIYNLKGNTGNKNILAASLAIKIPFVFYLYYYSGRWIKILAPLLFLFASFSIFIINSRAFILTLFILIIFYGIFCIIFYSRQRGMIKKLILNILAFLIPFIFSLKISNDLLREYAAKASSYAYAYGTVEQRLGAIGFTEEGTGTRFLLWKNAIKYINERPFNGAGIGNWKIIASKDDNKIYNDNFRSKHAHNDFLEITAEAGIQTGILYLSLFIVAAIILLKLFISKAETDKKSVGFIWLMLLAVYFIDATFNFPSERPVMQLYFMLMFAGITNLSLKNTANRSGEDDRRSFKDIIYLFTTVSVIALWVALSTYRSMVLQSKARNDTVFTKDFYKFKPKYRSEDFINSFPVIPNLSSIGSVPIAQIKARYLLAENRTEEALRYIRKSKELAPNSGLEETLLARHYYELKNIDSAYFYISKAFEINPRDKVNYQLLQPIAFYKNDTVLVEKSFRKLLNLRNESWVWTEYIYQLVRFKYDRKIIESKVDSALNFFPSDTSLISLKNQINEIKYKSLQKNNADPVKKEKVIIVNTQNIFDEGQKAFNNKEYKKAIALFLEYYKYKAEDPAGPLNAGLCYFQLSDYNAALPLLKTAAAMPKSADGKAEFFMGAVYYKLKNNEEACRYFRLSDQKKYPEAKAMLENICKKKN